MSYWSPIKIDGDTVRRVRAKCFETQTEFGKRFGKSKRTVIRWEKTGTEFSRWGNATKLAAWKELVKLYPRSFKADQRAAIKQ